MRGRIPTPTPLRVLEGKRPLKGDELKPMPGAPEPPAYLTPAQFDRWNEIVNSLPVGLLTKADTAVIERMAVAWAAYRETTQRIEATGLLVRGHLGEPVRNPLFMLKNQAAEEMEKCANALGLSPVARMRIAHPELLGNDPLSRLMRIWQQP